MTDAPQDYALVSSAECGICFSIGQSGWLAVAKPLRYGLRILGQDALPGTWPVFWKWLELLESFLALIRYIWSRLSSREVVFAQISFVHWRVVEGTCQNSSASSHELRWIFTEALYSYILVMNGYWASPSPKIRTPHTVSPQMFASQARLRPNASPLPVYIPLIFRANFESKSRSKGTHFVDSQSYASRHGFGDKREWPERTSHIWSTGLLIEQKWDIGIFGVRSTIITKNIWMANKS